MRSTLYSSAKWSIQLGRVPRSQMKSKTRSRGASMDVVMVIGPTAGRF